MSSWIPFVVFVSVATLVAVILGTVGDYFTTRGDRPGDRNDPRPDPVRAWAAIRAECQRRIRTTEKCRRVGRVVNGFLDEISDYRSATGEDAAFARQFLLDAIDRELGSATKPSIREALSLARSLLVEHE
jgi:hypothetical protein